MFFLGIFGIETRKKELRSIQNVVCKSCGMFTVYILIKTYNVFHFFFIPFFKWGEKYYVKSRCCGTIYEIPFDAGKRLEQGENMSFDNMEMREVYSGSSSEGRNIHCEACGRIIDSSFTYCPYCGHTRRK